MLMALYKGDWRLAGAIAYALPPHLVLNENSYEVSDALYRDALHTGAFGRAEGYLRKMYDLNPGHEMERDSLPAIIMVADLMRRQGKRLPSQQLFGSMERYLESDDAPYYDRDVLLATVMSMTGRYDAALKSLGSEIDQRHINVWYLVETEEFFSPLREDPRFKALFARERAYAAHQRALLEVMRQRGEVPTRTGGAAAAPPVGTTPR